MEEMNELVNLVLNSGGTVVMAVLFILFLYLDRRDRKDREEKEITERKEEREANHQLLNELSVSNRNIAESLNLLKTSLDNTNNEFRQHDERAIKEFEKIQKDLTILKERKNS
jgi:hypothetical protein